MGSVVTWPWIFQTQNDRPSYWQLYTLNRLIFGEGMNNSIIWLTVYIGLWSVAVYSINICRFISISRQLVSAIFKLQRRSHIKISYRSSWSYCLHLVEMAIEACKVTLKWSDPRRRRALWAETPRRTAQSGPERSIGDGRTSRRLGSASDGVKNMSNAASCQNATRQRRDALQ